MSSSGRGLHAAGVIVISVVCAAAAARPAQAQAPIPVIVPDAIRAAERQQLVSRRGAIVAEYQSLRDASASHDQRCSAVVEGSAEDAACIASQQRLQARISEYVRSVRAFDDAVASAPRAAMGDRVADMRSVRYPILQRRGEITLVSPGSRREYDGSSLKPGDQIRTGPNSTIVLILPDAGGAKIEIGPNSVFEYSPEDPSVFRLLQGSLREAVKCVLRGEYCRRTRVTSHNVCACVRGTEYLAEVLDSETIRLAVFEGVVDLLDQADQLVTTVERGRRVTARRRDGRWTIVPDGVAMRR